MQTTRALIHSQNLAHNIRLIRDRLPEQVFLCASVKANGYGHDAALVAQVAGQEGVTALGVANPSEGTALRRGGVAQDIYVYGNPLPDEAEETVESGLIPFLGDRESILGFARTAREMGRTARVHLKIDTGMGRIGCQPQEAVAMARLIAGAEGVALAGVCTHFAGSDMADPEYTHEQIRIFDAAVQAIRDQGIDPGILHASNTGGVIGFPRAHYDMVRVGIALYGYYPSDEQARDLRLRPVMELQSRVSFIKEVAAGTSISYGMTYRTTGRTTIATLPVGYGDGYSRLLSGRGQVLIQGTRYPIVGRVCMDQTMVDLGPDSPVGIGEPVTLFGPDPRGPDAEEIAGLMGTIPYEVTCLIAHRVPRLPV